MKIIKILSLAGLAAALTASASAFPFLVSTRNTALVPYENSQNSPTIAVSVHGQGAGKGASSKETTQPVAPTHVSSHRWR